MAGQLQARAVSEYVLPFFDQGALAAISVKAPVMLRTELLMDETKTQALAPLLRLIACAGYALIELSVTKRVRRQN